MLNLFNQFQVIAGPCSIESYDSLYTIASFLKKIGVTTIRGGSYKLRTSPGSFQGLGKEAIDYLHQICKALDLVSVSEIIDLKEIDYYYDKIDVMLIGTRNMYNYPLLKEIGKSNKPVILKRGMSATINEWLLAAEYISSEGNEKIILCERGIRTFETATRNTLDLSAIPVIKSLSKYPIFVDPSHATGNSQFVPSMALAATAGGANGLIIEVHQHPENALSDSNQMLNFSQFESLFAQLSSLNSFLK